MRKIYAAHYFRNGGSWGVILPPDVREALHLVPGDLMLMTLYGPLVIMRRATPEMIVEREQIPTDAPPPAQLHK